MELAKDLKLPGFDPQHDTGLCLESGPGMEVLTDNNTTSGIFYIMLSHDIDFQYLGDTQPGFMVSKKHSVVLKKRYPGINTHCTLDDIPLANYTVELPDGNFVLAQKSIRNINNACKRKAGHDYFDALPFLFVLHIPWVLKMLSEECDVFDHA